jgi:predicted Fe-Mo cluster-binding NifX family protein
MRICIPTHGDEGLGAEVAGHLGRAPFLTLVDTESGELAVIQNAPHRAGRCQPTAPLEGRGVEAVVCSGVGRRAMATLETAGIRVLTTHAARVAEVLESLRNGSVREMSALEACAGHAGHTDRGGCHGRS